MAKAGRKSGDGDHSAEAEWISEAITGAFGDHGGQAAFARFLGMAGSGLSNETIARRLRSLTSGRNGLTVEMRALLTILRDPATADAWRAATKLPRRPVKLPARFAQRK